MMINLLKTLEIREEKAFAFDKTYMIASWDYKYLKQIHYEIHEVEKHNSMFNIS